MGIRSLSQFCHSRRNSTLKKLVNFLKVLVNKRVTILGEVAEWSNAAVSKTVAQGNLGREFKSHPLRQIFNSTI